MGNHNTPKQYASAPATNGAAITPNNGTDLTTVCRGIYVGVTGDVQLTPVDMADGSSLVFKGAQAGSIIPVETKRVWAASTTATNLIAVW